MTDEKSDEKQVEGPKEAVEQPAVDQSPENVPAPTGEVRPIGERHGMFGVKGTGDTSGYGGLVAPVVYPANVKVNVPPLVALGSRTCCCSFVFATPS